MPKQTQRAEIKQFTGGLNTEAGPLSFPENASRDELNFDINPQGFRVRRYGMDVEKGGKKFVVEGGLPSADNVEYNTFVWKHPAGDTELSFLCVQIGNRLFFFNPEKEVMSEDGFVGSLSFNGFRSDVRYHMAAIEGFLVIANGSSENIVVDYNPQTKEFTYETSRIKIRDVFGIEETIDPRFESDKTYRGSSLNFQHYYNLYNQGWATPRFDWVKDGNTLQDAVFLGSSKGNDKYPSNSDKVWLGMEYRPVDNDETSVECFNYKQYLAVTNAETESAKGFFILDAMNRGASRVEQWNLHKDKNPAAGNLVSGSFTTKTDSTTGGATVLAEFAGRVFYSGFGGVVSDGDARSPNYNNFIFFTQQVKNKTDLGKCYQEGDPTSRENSDIIDTDGGFLKISEAKQIIAMFSIASKLIVLASNGVWSISGGSDYGFSATNYKVDKISTFGGLSSSSLVVEGDSAYFWAEDGIYSISTNQYGDLVAENITFSNIKSFYDAIPLRAKRQCFGMFDKYTRRIRWLYRDSERLTETTQFHELILDFTFGAFIPFRVKVNQNKPVFILSAFPTPLYSTSLEDFEVVVEEDLVYSQLDQVIAGIEFSKANFSASKYVGVNYNDEDGLFFCNYNNEKFRDWAFVDGVGEDAEAFMETGGQTLGDVAVQKQVPYLTSVLVKTEKEVVEGEVDTLSSCRAIVKWDFTHSGHAGRWSNPIQLYRLTRFYGPLDGVNLDNGYSYQINKTRLRGSGRAFAFRLFTEPYKDCQIVGWNLTVTGNGLT